MEEFVTANKTEEVKTLSVFLSNDFLRPLGSKKSGKTDLLEHPKPLCYANDGFLTAREKASKALRRKVVAPK